MARFGAIGALLSDRWQAPLVLLAAIAAGWAFHALRPVERQVDYSALIADVAVLCEAGAYRDAADAAANLLEMSPAPGPEHAAELHHWLAEAAYRRERARRDPIPHNVALIIEHHLAAEALRRPTSAAEVLRLAVAYEWRRAPAEAVEAYRRVLTLEPDAEQRRAAQRALIALLSGRPSAERERAALIQALLGDPGISASDLWWGVQTAMQDAFERGDLDGARELLASEGEHLKRSDLRAVYDYLHAWLLIREGRHLEADPVLRGVEEWFDATDGGERDLAAAGFRSALVRVLRGRIALSDQRPQQALSSFELAAEHEAPGEVLVAAAAGAAEALARLERHGAARTRIREAAQRLAQSTRAGAAGLPRLSRIAYDLHRERQEIDDWVQAVDYMAVALELAPAEEASLHRQWNQRLAQVAAHAAARREAAERRDDLLLLAARHFEAAADLAGDDADAQSDLLWSAIEFFGRVRRTADERRLLERFVAARASDPRAPRARLLLAEGYESDGDLDLAIQSYDHVIQSVPNLAEAVRARLRRAECLLAKGEEHERQAEQALLALLESDAITPEAPVFRDALLSLAELLYRQRRLSESIRRLEDYLTLYPDGPAAARARFLLADAFRRSAYALRDEPPAGVPPARSGEESRARFRRSAELFASLEELDAADEEGALYERLALLYRADCLFELNEPETLDQALSLYRQASARHQREPAALSAQVQIAAIHLRRGNLGEAARAVENARWLLRGIPDEAFVPGVEGHRGAWDRYLGAVAASHLLRDALAAGN